MQPFEPQLLPIASIHWERLISSLGPANRALAGFNGVLYGLRNQDVLLSPLTTQEAVLSSRIEGTQASLGEVLKFEAGEEPGQESRKLDIQEILNYRSALRRAQDELKTRPFNLNLLLELHSVLLDSVRGRDKDRGHFRRIQNWIGKPGSLIEQATFVPPAPGELPGHLDNWEKYYHSDDRDLLVQLAIVHAQFELLHPFLDGNGRLGRLLIPLFLFEKNLLVRPAFYLSAYLERYRDEYMDRLQALGHDSDGWNKWVEFFLRAITEQAEANVLSARNILALYEEMKNKIIALTRSRHAVPLLDAMFEHPIFSSGTLIGRPGLPGKPMTMRLLRQLRDGGILTVLGESSGRKAQIFAFPELLKLVDQQEWANQS